MNEMEKTKEALEMKKTNEELDIQKKNRTEELEIQYQKNQHKVQVVDPIAEQKAILEEMEMKDGIVRPMSLIAYTSSALSSLPMINEINHDAVHDIKADCDVRHIGDKSWINTKPPASGLSQLMKISPTNEEKTKHRDCNEQMDSKAFDGSLAHNGSVVINTRNNTVDKRTCTQEKCSCTQVRVFLLIFVIPKLWIIS